MSQPSIIDLSTLVGRGQLFRPPSWPDRVEAFLPTLYHSNHAPNLVELENGDLLCAWFAGTEEGVRDIKIVLARLNATSGAWTEPVRLSDDYTRSEQNPVLFAAPNGKVYLFYTAQATQAESRAEFEELKKQGKVQGGFTAQWTAIIRRRVSEDNGQTWGPIETAFATPGSFCRQPIIVMSNGEWLFPCYYSLLDKEGKHSEDYTVMQIAGDEGQTWTEVEVPRSRGRVHASVLELAPGKLISFFRSRAADWIYVSHSDDYGRSWSEPVPTVLPSNNASMRAVRLHSGALAMIFNHYQAQTEDPHATVWPNRRWPLTIALSEDEGETWPYQRHFDTSDDFSGEANQALNSRLEYPCMIQTRDGDIHLAYAYRNRQCIKYGRISEAWIRNERVDLRHALGWS